MRTVPKLLWMAPILFGSGIANAAATYYLEAMVDAAASERAPTPLQTFMAQATEPEFSDCIEQLGYAAPVAASYFAAQEVSLSETNTRTWLVYPSESCFAFFGAHAIAFWLVEADAQGGFRLVHAGHQDAVTIADEQHAAYRDVIEHYGANTQRFEFDGSAYRIESASELTWSAPNTSTP